MSVGVITNLLKEHGYRVGDLTERLWHTKGVNISHSQVCAYCRASDGSYGKIEVWRDIVDYLSEMGISWNYKEG